MTPVSQITIHVTFGTWENFYTGTLQFEVADFEIAYNDFSGRPALSKFMAIPHYAFLILKMPRTCGVISIREDIKQSFNCVKERCETVDRFTASTELNDLKQVFVNSPPPSDLVMPEAKTSKTSIQPEDTISKIIPLSTEEPSKVAHVGKNLDPKWELMLVKLLKENRDIFAWKLANMPGVLGELTEDELHLDPKAKLVK
jgi:hypothetical protein